MENIIHHYYNLLSEEMKTRYGGFLFYANDEKYFLTEVKQKPEELLRIYNILLRNGIGNYIIVNNKEGSQITKHDNVNYILYRVRCEDDGLITRRELFNIKEKSNNTWSKTWGDRIDYYEIQINEIGQDKGVILKSINYYIGLAENAIAIATKYEKELSEEDYSLQHYRMNVPIYRGEYYNPNNILIDINVRDIAEYVKSSFFNTSKNMEDYLDYVLSFNLDNKKANLLFARLLYPTHYFDLFDEVIFNEKEEDELIPIIRESIKYEEFLGNLYLQLSQKYQMTYISWIKKRARAPH